VRLLVRGRFRNRRRGNRLEPAALSSLKKWLDPSLGTTDSQRRRTSCGAWLVGSLIQATRFHGACDVNSVVALALRPGSITRRADFGFGRRRPTHRRTTDGLRDANCKGKAGRSIAATAWILNSETTGNNRGTDFRHCRRNQALTLTNRLLGRQNPTNGSKAEGDSRCRVQVSGQVETPSAAALLEDFYVRGGLRTDLIATSRRQACICGDAASTAYIVRTNA